MQSRIYVCGIVGYIKLLSKKKKINVNISRTLQIAILYFRHGSPSKFGGPGHVPLIPPVKSGPVFDESSLYITVGESFVYSIVYNNISMHLFIIELIRREVSN